MTNAADDRPFLYEQSVTAHPSPLSMCCIKYLSDISVDVTTAWCHGVASVVSTGLQYFPRTMIDIRSSAMIAIEIGIEFSLMLAAVVEVRW